MNSFKELIRNKVHLTFHLTLIFGVIGVVFAFFGIIFSFIGIKDISELFALIFAACMLLSIFFMWLLNKYKD